MMLAIRILMWRHGQARFEECCWTGLDLGFLIPNLPSPSNSEIPENFITREISYTVSYLINCSLVVFYY